MAESSDNNGQITGSFSSESINIFAETIGIGRIPEEGAKVLAEDITYRLRMLLQVSSKPKE